MKITPTFIFSFFIILLFLNCGQNRNHEDDKKDTDRNTAGESGVPNDLKIADTSTSSTVNYKLADIDTIYPFEVKGKVYRLILSHEIPSANGDLTTTVRIVENHDTLYKKTFDFNTVGQIVQPVPGYCWLDLYNSGGGSGFSGTIFNIKIDSVITLQPLTNFDELSYWKSNRTATEFIFSEGIWNMGGDVDSDNFESHFDKHKQEISICKIENDTVLVRDLGLTKHKLDFSENENPLIEFRKKEPALAKQIHWEDYDLPE